MTEELPLAGLTVLDMSHLAAGPWCTMVLADLGADVIKIENPDCGDMSRRAGSVYAGDQSAVFLALNRNKRSVALDLKHPRGREAFYRLVDAADVFVENLRPGKSVELGVGYEHLGERNPGIVYASVSAFGQDGPYAGLAGNDPIVQALSGAMSITGDPDGPPARQGVSVPDFGAGMLAAFSIVSAVAGRGASGRGRKLDLNLLDVSIFALGPRGQEYLVNGEDQPRLGSAHPQFAPYQAYRCKGDRYIYIAAINEKFWHKLCRALDRTDLASDPRFATNVDRTGRRAELQAEIEPILLRHDREEWLAVLQEHGVPCGPVNTLVEAMNDPQVGHNELIQNVEHASVGKMDTIGLPLHIDGERLPIRCGPPLLGEHTRQVLAEYGLEEGDVETLFRSGAAAGEE